MTEFLCLGGPLHGQVLDVPEPDNGLTVQPPASEQLLRPAGAPPLMPARYVLRGAAAQTPDGKKYVRQVMALEQLQPQQLMMALATALVTEWVREGEEIGEDSGPDEGPGGADQHGGMRGGSGPSDHGGTGTGLIAP